MRSKRNIVLLWVLATLPAVMVAAVYGRLPRRVPIQWGFDGVVNTWGDKSVYWIIALVCLLMAAMFQFLPFVDPKRRSYTVFQKYYDGFALLMELFMVLLTAVTLVESLHPGTVSIGRVVTVAFSVLLVFLGNMMGKIKHNYFMGIKTPWTLADPDVWNRTHRFTGRLWFLVGVVTIPCALALPEGVFGAVFGVGIVLSTGAGILMSYIWYRRAHREEDAAGDDEGGGPAGEP